MKNQRLFFSIKRYLRWSDVGQSYIINPPAAL